MKLRSVASATTGLSLLVLGVRMTQAVHSTEHLIQENNEEPQELMDMMMMMYMWFWSDAEKELNWLFKNVVSDSGGEYFAGLLVTFLLAIVLEGITFARNYIYMKEQVKAIRASEELNQ